MDTRHKFNTLELGKRIIIFVTLGHKLPPQMRKYEKLNSLVLVILLLTDFGLIQTSERATNTRNRFSTIEFSKTLFLLLWGHLPKQLEKI
jgi:hypothetical protein